MLDDEVKFVTGKSLNSVAIDIRRDLHWSRLSGTRWEDENGQAIRYLQDPSQLHGLRNIRVYLLPGYDQRDNWWELSDMMTARGAEFEVL